MRRRHQVIAAVVLAALTGTGVAVADTGNDPSTERIDALHDAVEPASVVVEARDGDRTWTTARGQRDQWSGAETEPTDHFNIGSINKSMVSVILLQLAEEGGLTLDDPIDRHLPGLLPYEDTITVRQLLTHNSGVPDHLQEIYPSLRQGSAEDIRQGRFQEYAPRELIDVATRGPLDFPPGQGWSYSNTGYFVLGLLIEELTGRDFATVLRERVLDEAGMDEAYLPTEPAIRGPHPRAYMVAGFDDPSLIDTTEFSPTQFWAAGGVIAPTDDVNDFFRAMFDGTLLSPEQLEQARQIAEPSPDERPYALGLFVAELPSDCPIGDTAYGHTGSSFGYSTYSFHSRDGQRQVTVMYGMDAQFDPDRGAETAVQAAVVAGLCEPLPE